MTCKIYTNDLALGSSPLAIVFAAVWKRILQETLREFTYMAETAQLVLTIGYSRDCIDFTWQGYNDSLVSFVTESL